MRAGRREPVGSGGQKPERDSQREHGQGAELVTVIRQEPERQDHEGQAEGVAGVIAKARDGVSCSGLLPICRSAIINP